MKQRDVLRKLQLIGMLSLGIVPAPVLLFNRFCPQMLPWSLMYPGALFLLSTGALLLRGKWRLRLGIPLAILAVAAAALLAPAGNILAAGCAVVCGGLLIWSLQLGSWERERELPVLAAVSLFACHLLGQFVLLIERLTQRNTLGVYGRLMSLAFLGLILLMAFSLNRISMNDAGGEFRSVSRAMRQKNRFLTLGLFLLALGASFIPKIYDWLRQAFLWLVAFILWLLSRILPEMEAGESAGDGGFSAGMLPAEESQTTLFGQILEIILYVVAGLVLAALAVFVLYRLGKLLIFLSKKLWKSMGRFAGAVAQDYEEEITDTRKEKNTAVKKRGISSENFRFVTKQPEDPRLQVRERYRWLLRKHRRWSVDSTARENLSPEAAEVYERARYSDHAVTAADAERFRSDTRKC